MSDPLITEVWDVEALIPYDDNAKIHTEEQIKALSKAIKKFGWDQPIVVEEDGTIIKGHGRRLAAMELGLLKVPVIVRRDLTKDQARAARLSDNRVALGDIDESALRRELSSLNVAFDGDLGDLGFSNEELGFLQGDIDDFDLGGDLPEQPGMDTSPNSSKTPKGEEYEPSYQVVVICKDEGDQEKIYNDMTERGYNCRVLSM